MGDSTMHAELSPSRRHRWAACPGSIREEARYPEPPAGDAAIQGTRTHTILERAIHWEFILEREPLDLSRLAKDECRDDTGIWVVGPERVDRVDVALTWLREQVDEKSVVKAEQRVYPDGLVGRADMSGTVDIQIQYPKTGRDTYVVADYKDGVGVVDVENNPQLTQYGLGVLAGLPEDQHPDWFEFVVIQPKNALKGLPVITSWRISTGDLLAMVPVIVAQAAATEDPNAPLVPGEAQCKYCRAKATCPALTGMVSDMFGPVTTVVQAAPDLAVSAANRDPEKMTGEELRKFLDAAPLVEGLLESVRTEAKRRLENNIPVPGYKMVRGNGSREWNLSEEEMVKKLGPGGMNIPKGSLYEKKFVSPAKAEKLTWEDSKGETKKLTSIQLKRLQSEYVTSRAGKPTLAPESDPRPAIVTDASDLMGSTEQVVTVQATPVPPLPAFFAPVATPAPVELPSWFK